MSSLCELVDAYLGEALSEAERTAFQEHLAGCDPCRQAIADYAELGSLLRQANQTLQLVPTDLVRRIDARLRQQRRRAVRWVARLAAAAAILAALGLAGWWLTRQPADPPPPQAHVAPAPQIVEPVPLPRATVHLSPATKAEYLVQSVKTQNPNVTVIWLYEAGPRRSASLTKVVDPANDY